MEYGIANSCFIMYSSIILFRTILLECIISHYIVPYHIEYCGIEVFRWKRVLELNIASFSVLSIVCNSRKNCKKTKENY